MLPGMFNRTASNGSSSAYTGYGIGQSMLLDGSSDYLSWTPASAGDRKTWTYSILFRRCALGVAQALYGCRVDGNNFENAYFDTSDKLTFYSIAGGSTQYFGTTDMQFRDAASYYHAVISKDAANSTLKCIVNGVDVPITWSTSPSNADGSINTTSAHYIGRRSAAINYYFNGHFADYRFLDGFYTSDGTEFGEFYNGTTKWRAIEPSGLTYVTNGFYLDFSNSGDLGEDQAGSNDWTVNGSPEQSSDSPTINVCTWNPLNNFYHALANGNRTVTSGGNYSWRGVGGTIAVPATGKWYYECALTSTGTLSAGVIGWIEAQVAFDTDMSDSFANMAGLYVRNDSGSGQTKYLDFTGTGTDIESVEIPDSTIGIAIDFDAAKVWIAKDDTWYSGDPGSGTGGYSITVDSTKLYTPFTTPVATSANPWTNVTAFAEDEWTYTAPTNFKAITAANLPEVTITDPGEHFNAVGYTGDGTAIGSGGNAITGVGFQSDFTWIKNRDQADSHMLFDVIRGATEVLHSDSTAAETTESETLDSFDSDGFTLGSDAEVNTNTEDYISWNWKAGGAGVANTDGSISSTVSVNDDAGFSIAGFTGTGSAGTVGHGQSAAPEMIIVKNRDTAARDWATYHSLIASDAETDYLSLNSTAASADSANWWNDIAPTSSVFSVGSTGHTNQSGDNMIAYCFRSIPGYSKVFSYTGNGSADGQFVYLGFNPRFILSKNASGSYSWYIHDTERSAYNVVDDELYPNTSNDEGSTDRLDIVSNGFKQRFTGAALNGSGNTIVGIAFADYPFGGSNVPVGLAA